MTDRIAGIDISRWQGKMDWDRAWKEGARFVIIKATQGRSYKDPNFERNAEEALGKGFALSYYHYFERDQDGLAQAEHFMRVTDPYPLHFESAIDAEDPTKIDIALTTSRMQRLVQELIGYKLGPGVATSPLMYSTRSWFESQLLPWSGWDECGLWVAHWGVPEPTLPRYWKKWKIWQHGLEPGAKWGAQSNQIDVNWWNVKDFPFPGAVKPENKPEVEVIDLGNGYGEVKGDPKDLLDGERITILGNTYRLVKE